MIYLPGNCHYHFKKWRKEGTWEEIIRFYEKNDAKPKEEKQHPVQALSTVSQPKRLAPRVKEAIMQVKRSKAANDIYWSIPSDYPSGGCTPADVQDRDGAKLAFHG